MRIRACFENYFCCSSRRQEAQISATLGINQSLRLRKWPPLPGPLLQKRRGRVAVGEFSSSSESGSSGGLTPAPTILKQALRHQTNKARPLSLHWISNKSFRVSVQSGRRSLQHSRICASEYIERRIASSPPPSPPEEERGKTRQFIDLMRRHFGAWILLTSVAAILKQAPGLPGKKRLLFTILRAEVI